MERDPAMGVTQSPTEGFKPFVAFLAEGAGLSHCQVSSALVRRDRG